MSLRRRRPGGIGRILPGGIRGHPPVELEDAYDQENSGHGAR